MQNDDEVLQREAIDWLTRLKSGAATVTDVESFQLWAAQTPRHAHAFSEVRRLWDALGPAGLTAMARLKDGEGRFVSRTPGRIIGRRAMLGGGLAAGIAAAGYLSLRPPLGLWPALPEVLEADVRTSTGEQRRVALADDVAIELNTRTSIAFRPAEAGTTRIELISGEGVISGPGLCEVVAGAGRAHASQASFCVRRDGAAVWVTCLEGAVEVVCGAVRTALATGQRLTYQDAVAGDIEAVDTKVVTAWRTGQLIFHDTPLRDVVAEANRYRRGRIVIANPALGRRLVNARIRLDQIDALVAKLTAAFAATARSLPGGIVILS